MLSHIRVNFTRQLRQNPYATTIKLFFILFAIRIALLFTLFSIAYPQDSVVNFIKIFARRWDGNSYTFIAENWYVTSGAEAAFIVFPPLYPTIIRLFSFIQGSHIYVAFFLSNLFYILGSIIFYSLLRKDYSHRFSLYTVILLALFPTSYFFSAAYPESLLLVLFAASFYLARQNNYLAAAIVAGLAVITRPFGIALFPALFVEWLYYSKRSLKDLAALVISGSFFSLVYLTLNFALFADAFVFQKFLSSTWQKTFAFPWVSITKSWKRGIFTPEWTTYKILTGYAEAIASTSIWLSIPLAFATKLNIRLSYLVYLLFGAVLFTSTDFILSAPRYLLSLPPFFIILAHFANHKLVKIPFVVISTICLIAVALLFTQGQWSF